MTFSRAKTNSQYVLLVFVIVVMACCANCRSVIFRLFVAIRILRVFGSSPNPFRSCWEIPAKSVDCTDGLKMLNVEVDELRVLFHDAKRPVPV